MSKAVKSVGRAISKVVKGAVKIVTSGVKATIGVVKKIASSKLGKILLVAAAVYFGGAALMGGMSSSAAGGSFLSGMGTGVANAATSLSGAWSSALSGNFGAAGSSLSAGFQGTTTALQAGAQGAATLAGNVAANTAANTAANGAFTGATETGLLTLPGDAANVLANGAAKSPGLIASLSPMGQYAAIGGATQITAGAIQGAGMQAEAKRQEGLAAQAKADQDARYRASIDEFSASAKAGAAAQAPGGSQYTPMAAYDPVAEAKAIGDRYRADFDARNQEAGLVARGMASNPQMTNNNFPVYNPYYYRG